MREVHCGRNVPVLVVKPAAPEEIGQTYLTLPLSNTVSRWARRSAFSTSRQLRALRLRGLAAGLCHSRRIGERHWGRRRRVVLFRVERTCGQQSQQQYTGAQ